MGTEPSTGSSACVTPNALDKSLEPRVSAQRIQQRVHFKEEDRRRAFLVRSLQQSYGFVVLPKPEPDDRLVFGGNPPTHTCQLGCNSSSSNTVPVQRREMRPHGTQEWHVISDDLGRSSIRSLGLGQAPHKGQCQTQPYMRWRKIRIHLKRTR